MNCYSISTGPRRLFEGLSANPQTSNNLSVLRLSCDEFSGLPAYIASHIQHVYWTHVTPSCLSAP